MGRSVSPRSLSRLAVCGLVAVFVGMCGYAVFEEANNRATLDEVERAVVLNDAYTSALLGLTDVELAGTRFAANAGDTEASAAFESALGRVETALLTVAAAGDPSDQALVRAIADENMPHLDVVRRFFAARSSGVAFAETMPDHGTAEAIRAQLAGPAEHRRAQAAAALAGQRGVLHDRLLVRIAVNGAGLLLMLLLMRTMHASRRREAATLVQIDELRTAALTDSLTGLGNHRAFQDALTAEYARAQKSGEPIALAVLDVDQFKEVNDLWGHDRGDDLLEVIAGVLREECGTRAQAFRIGGDEFAVVFPSMDGFEAMQLAGQIRETVEGLHLGATLSAGVSAAYAGDEDPDLLREEADAALYEAKRGGRNNVVEYMPGSSAGLLFADAKLQALREILADGPLEVVFQPIWDLVGGQPLAHEALARLPKDAMFAGPQEAFDMAERTGRGHDLDAMSFDAIFRRCGELPGDSQLFVNVSPATFTHHSFSAAALADRARLGGFSPSRVVLEITERAAIPAGLLREKVDELHAQGFQVALDDVGAGNAGLELLRVVPVDWVKIDRTVLTSALEDKTARAVLVAIIAFARESGAQVVAEGIETPEVLELVERLAQTGEQSAVRAIQGYYLARPNTAPVGPGSNWRFAAGAAEATRAA